MKKYITSFGGTVLGHNRHMESFGITRDYTREVDRLFSSAKPFGLTPLYYDDIWLLSSKYSKIQDADRIFKEDSYGWAFKSVVIKDALGQMDDGDILLWCDSNHIVVANPEPLFDLAKEHNLYLHDHWNIIYPNKDWATKDMFFHMNCDEEKYWNARQIQVNIMAFYKTEFTKMFVDEWVKYSLNYDVMIENKMENYSGFSQPRHEQSILSILREKYNIPFFTYPYQIIHEMDGIDIKAK